MAGEDLDGKKRRNQGPWVISGGGKGGHNISNTKVTRVKKKIKTMDRARGEEHNPKWLAPGT